MTSKKRRRIAIIDNSIDASIYKPIEHWSANLDAEWVAFRALEGELPGRADDFSHILLTGSEASILDGDKWMEDEIGFVREAFQRNLSILGSCYGHQLLAVALTGRSHVRRCRQPEIGWVPIEILRDNSLLGKKRRAFTFSLHYDEVFDLPQSLTVWASTPACRIQAFGYPSRNVWGLQIHPEINVPSARALMKELVDFNPESRLLYEAALASEPRDSGLIHQIINAFLAFPLDKNRNL